MIGSSTTASPSRRTDTSLPENLNDFGRRTACERPLADSFAVTMVNTSGRHIVAVKASARLSNGLKAPPLNRLFHFSALVLRQVFPLFPAPFVSLCPLAFMSLRLRTATPVTFTSAQPKPTAGPNPNLFFATVAAGTPEIADPATLPVLTLRPATTVDFATTPGATYTLTPAP